MLSRIITGWLTNWYNIICPFTADSSRSARPLIWSCVFFSTSLCLRLSDIFVSCANSDNLRGGSLFTHMSLVFRETDAEGSWTRVKDKGTRRKRGCCGCVVRRANYSDLMNITLVSPLYYEKMRVSSRIRGAGRPSESASEGEREMAARKALPVLPGRCEDVLESVRSSTNDHSDNDENIYIYVGTRL